VSYGDVRGFDYAPIVMQIRGTRSLQVVGEEVRAVRNAQLQHFDSIDTKAGVVLGFAAGLVALAPDRASPFVRVGRAIAVLSGFLALWTVWPRRYWSTNLRSLRDKHLSADPEFTLLQLLDTKIDMAERTAGILHIKANRLKWAMITLASAVLMTGIGLGVD
jgi:hypothetical protein